MVICGGSGAAYSPITLLIGEKTPRPTRFPGYIPPQRCPVRKWLGTRTTECWNGWRRPANAEAAKRVKGEWNSGGNLPAIWLAKLYGLTRIAEKIEDRPDNSHALSEVSAARCAAHRRRQGPRHRLDAQTSQGRCNHLLQPVPQQRLEACRGSKPDRRAVANGTYVFFIDFYGHQHDPLIQGRAASRSMQSSVALKVLGFLPKAVL